MKCFSCKFYHMMSDCVPSTDLLLVFNDKGAAELMLGLYVMQYIFVLTLKCVLFAGILNQTTY